jgi:acid phosphatase
MRFYRGEVESSSLSQRRLESNASEVIMNRVLISFLLLIAAAQPGSGQQQPTAPMDCHHGAAEKHFDRILIVVLENQAYVSAIKDPYLKQLADEGLEFTNYRGVEHPSYPNYLAMIAGSTFGLHGWFGDNQKNFPDDEKHRTIGDLIEWKNYAEDCPAKPGQPPYLKSTFRKYARKHVPFLSFKKIQKKGYENVVGVDTKDPNNAFVTDVSNSRKDQKDSQHKNLPTFMLYTPNMDDDGHDTNLATASRWLKNFLENWFPPEARGGTLTVITFDEGEPPEEESNHIYTIFLGDMVKKGQNINTRYDHFDLLRTVENNFGLVQLNYGDCKATGMTGIWK